MYFFNGRWHNMRFKFSITSIIEPYQTMKFNQTSFGGLFLTFDRSVAAARTNNYPHQLKLFISISQLFWLQIFGILYFYPQIGINLLLFHALTINRDWWTAGLGIVKVAIDTEIVDRVDERISSMENKFDNLHKQLQSSELSKLAITLDSDPIRKYFKELTKPTKS